MTLQFAVLGLLIAVVTIATIVVSYNRVFERAENASLAIARTVAASGQVREEVARYSALETLDLNELRTGPLQQLADDVRGRAGADFVAILEDRGLRLAHPNPDEIGKPASTDPVALRGVEAVLRERGSLGDSVRAKVPVYAPGSGRVVGQVTVGVVTDSLTGALLVLRLLDPALCRAGRRGGYRCRAGDGAPAQGPDPGTGACGNGAAAP